jgi:transcriptional regulator with XRE-family HTH domain
LQDGKRDVQVRRLLVARLAANAKGAPHHALAGASICISQRKRCRGRIAPERASLGPYLRLPIRIGKLVTQEEVAEVVGISRVWYGMLENERPVRVSTAVLGRIADALMMDPVERASLFRLAFPELRSTSLADDSAGLLDTIGSLRLLTRRLWAATTEAEALTVVRTR